MRALRPSIIAVATVVIFSGCSSDASTDNASIPGPAPSASASVSPQPQEEVDAEPTLQEIAPFFAAIVGGDPATIRSASEELAAPGSNAHTYATYYAGYTQAMRDAGLGSETGQELETLQDGFNICGADLDGSRKCDEFGNFTYSGGLLTDFDAGGTPIAGRIIPGSGEALPLGASGTVKLLAAYRSIANYVIFVVEVQSAVNQLTVSYSSTYQAPDGRQSDPAELVGPFELRAGSLANYALVYPGAEFGGTLRLEAYDATYTDYAVEIPTT